MNQELWCVEGYISTPWSGSVQPDERVIANSHKDAREFGHAMLAKGYRVFAWDMMGSGQFKMK